MGLEKKPLPETERKPVEGHPPDPGVGREQRGIDEHIADADERVRKETGRKEPVRNTPPAGEWNDTAPNE
jgi:hypothetical protein